MKTTSKLLIAVSAIPLTALGAAPAFAGPYENGTAAGTEIENKVSVSYSVAGTAQTSVESNTDKFVVDRVIDLTVAEANGQDTVVAPDAADQVVSFQVTNLSNDVLDFGLTATQGTSDQFDTTGVLIYVDTDGDGDYTNETAVDYIDELPAGDTVTVFVVSKIPNGVVTGNEADIILTAQALSGDVSGTKGSVFTPATSNGAMVVDTIFADINGDDDTAKDGKHSDTDTYIVSAADLDVVKTSKIVSDPVNGTANPMAIPGAIVEYCIAVTNAAGGASATGVSISDTLPTTVTYDTTNMGVKAQGGDCSTPGTVDGAHASGVVSGNLGTIGAGQTSTLIFQAKIN